MKHRFVTMHADANKAGYEGVCANTEHARLAGSHYGLLAASEAALLRLESLWNFVPSTCASPADSPTCPRCQLVNTTATVRAAIARAKQLEAKGEGQ